MADYVVTSVVQSQEIGAAGNLIDNATVYFTFADEKGVGSVQLPITDNFPAQAQAAIEAKVAELLPLFG